jgi:hypothetical protein
MTLPVLRKYPRTPHLEGSRIQSGDEDLAVSPLSVLSGKYIVVEEKVDGANVGVSFTPNGLPLLQSRGHYLTGGPRERQFELLKAWVATHQLPLYERLGSRYIMYGEWLYALHTVFYDSLPHYFLEFDILDTQEDAFLSTERRREMLDGLPIRSVPVLWSGPVARVIEPHHFVTRTSFKSPRWRESFFDVAEMTHADVPRVDSSDQMEGIYIKVEDAHHITERYKIVRSSFQTAIEESASHWSIRPIIPNQLQEGVNIFAPTL